MHLFEITQGPRQSCEKAKRPKKPELYPGLSKLAKTGVLIAPRQLSKRAAMHLVRHGLATVYLFHQRWNLKLDITAKGRIEGAKDMEGENGNHRE